MKYLLRLVVETDDDAEIPETFLEGDEPITKYLSKIGNVGGDFVKLVVQKLYNGLDS